MRQRMIKQEPQHRRATRTGQVVFIIMVVTFAAWQVFGVLRWIVTIAENAG